MNQEWEYCALMALGRSGTSLNVVNPSALYRFTSDGTVEEKLAGKQYHEMGKAIARLGAEGWEMVGVGTTDKGETHILYFKRAKPQTP